jgi:riboflavin biosynthesis pyrimidine reductase
LKDVRKVIISRSSLDLPEGFIQATSPEDALSKLESEGFSEAIVTGGATINSEFAKRNLIDEVILDVNPSIVGNGLPVFAPEYFMLKLELIGSEKVGKNIVELKYKVEK